MNTRFFTIGPSKLFPTVSGHMSRALKDNIPSVSHRGSEFHNIFSQTTSALRRFLSIPDAHRIFFLSSATEGMERIVQNCVEKKSLHLVNGAFAKKFWQTSVAYGKDAIRHDVAAISDLSPSVSEDIEMIAITQNETSTGMVIPTEASHALKRANPHALLAVDTVSTTPYAPLDYSLVDCAFFSVQKGFGLPAGLGVLIISDSALAKAAALTDAKGSVGWYHSFAELKKYAAKNETPETPNVLAIYLLGKVLADMEQVGIRAIRKGIEERADMLSRFVDEHPERLSFFQKDPALRSQTTIVLEVAGSSRPLMDKLRAHGLIVGAGYGEYKDHHIRIANFPAHTTEDMTALITGLSDVLL